MVSSIPRADLGASTAEWAPPKTAASAFRYTRKSTICKKHWIEWRNSAARRSCRRPKCRAAPSWPCSPTRPAMSPGFFWESMLVDDRANIPTASPVESDPVISKKLLWTGRIASGLAALFFLMEGVMKLFKPAVVIEATRQLGYPASAIMCIGVLLLVCTLLYLFPRTSILGSILLTGYMGGAVASQVRFGAGWFNVAFAVLFGVLVLAGLWLRDVRVRNLLP